MLLSVWTNNVLFVMKGYVMIFYQEASLYTFFLPGLMDALHKGAFRDTLGNPLYMTADHIGSFSPQTVGVVIRLRTIF